MHARALAILATVQLAGCAGSDEPPFEHRVLAMGTWVDIVAVAGDTAQASSATPDIDRLLRDFERDYYAWGDGELSRLNRALTNGEPFTASPELAALLESAKRLSEASGGAFDPGVGPLVELWGFNDEANLGHDPPDPDAVADLLGGITRIRDVTIAGTTIRAPPATATLDLGGIAKGEAVDRIIGLLERHGVEHAMVDAGGDLRVIGTPPNRFWRIGIRAPRGSDLIGVIELGDGEAAFTSGDYERYFEYDGVRAHHLIDPATGYPATHTEAVTVVADDGVTADAAATALFVAGPDAWRTVARALGVDRVLRVDASGEIEVTKPMRERLQISSGNTSDIIVVDP